MNRRSIRQGTKGLLSFANIMKKEDLVVGGQDL